MTFSNLMPSVAKGYFSPESFPTPPIIPNWEGFFAYIQTTSVWTYLNTGSAANLQINAITTFLRDLIGEAAQGLPKASDIQGGLDILWPALATPYKVEITSGISTFSLPLTVPA